MESIASELKAQRESRNISLAQIAADTNISLRHLQSLEDGRFNDLPGGMYNRAFLRAYCEFLKLDQAEILQRYESEVLPHANKPVKAKSPITSSIHIPPIAIWSLMFLISATGIFLKRKWFFAALSPYFSSSSGVQENDLPSKHPMASVPAKSQAPFDSTAVKANTTPLENEKTDATPAQELPSPAAPQSINPEIPASSSKTLSTHKLQLDVVGKEKCWISVNRDGVSVFSRIIQPGEIQSFNADQKLFIIFGNAGGVELKINGKPARPLGKSGDVIKLLINETTLPDLIDQSAG